MNVLYYESHITIEPVFGARLEKFRELCVLHNFRAADLLMQKDRSDTPTRSDKDTFCTGRAPGTYEGRYDISSRMHLLAADLGAAGFQVWRTKIEAVIFDRKFPHV